jgi:cytochrome c-type protein NapB
MQEALTARRKVQLALAVGVGLVVSAGLVAGLRPPPSIEEGSPLRHDAAVPHAAEANTNIVWKRLRDLALSAPVSEDVKEHRTEALATRAARRAYDGAPPRVPHQVDQRNAPDCLFCHSEGLSVAGRVAPKLSHQPYLNCLQCHVVERSAGNDWVIPQTPGAPAPQKLDTAFEGASLAEPVAPWGVGAPPPMPHTQHMRSDCASCHGPSGRDGLRTSHPQRQNCLQCHAQSVSEGSRRLDGAL